MTHLSKPLPYGILDQFHKTTIAKINSIERENLDFQQTHKLKCHINVRQKSQDSSLVCIPNHFSFSHQMKK